MTDLLALDLVEKGLATDQITLTIGYDRDSLVQKGQRYYYSSTGQPFHGRVTPDAYGRPHPYHAHGTKNLKDYARSLNGYTSSTEIIMKAMLVLFEQIMDRDLYSRRIHVVAARVKPAAEISIPDTGCKQLNLFTDYAALEQHRKEEAEKLEREHRLQLATLKLRKRYGKNAVLKGMNLEESGTTIERNGRIGGHRSGT